MTACLLIENGRRKGETIDLAGLERTLVIGADAERAQLVLEEDFVAPRHAALGRLKDGGLGLRNLHDDEPVRINDEPVRNARLHPGDRIQIGSVILSYLEHSPEHSGADHTAEARTPVDEMVGNEIGGFRLLEHLGRGGMGTVYRALQISLDREVALKMLSPKLCADRNFVEQFIREARAAGKLNHPNIVQVYDVSHEGERYFYAMEYIAGGSLETRMRRSGKLPWREALAAVRDAAHGLEYAESLKIVHRDIKPDNLMVNDRGVVKIADLGLAGSHDESFEKHTGILGTPHFISPEQAQGKPIDSRADLYSLGATCYSLLAGRTPFHGSTVKEIIRAQIQDDPQPLSTIDPGIPDAVQAIVSRLMRKDPQERYGSAAELIADIDTALAGSGSTHGRTRRIAAAALVLAIAATGTFLALQGSREEGAPASSAETPPAATEEPGPKTEPQTAERDPTPPPRTGPDDAELRHQLRVTNAALALERARKVQGERQQRLEAFRRVAEKYADTPHGAEAAAEVARLEGEQREIDGAREQMRAGVDEELPLFHYDAALSLVSKTIAALPEELRADRTIVAAARAERERIAERAEADLLERSKIGRQALDKKDFAGALDVIDAMATSFELSAATAGALPPAITKRFAKLHPTLAADRELVLKQRAQHRHEVLEENRLQTYRALYAASGAVKRIKGHRYRSALEEIDACSRELSDEGYRAFLARRRAEVEHAMRAHSQLLASFSRKSARVRAIRHPDTGRRCYLLGIEADQLVLSKRRDGSNPIRVDISAVDTPQEIADLYVARLGDTAAEAIDLGYLLVLQDAIHRALQARGMIANYLRSNSATSLAATTPTAEIFDEPRALLATAGERGGSPEEISALQAFLEREEHAAQCLERAFKAIAVERFVAAEQALDTLRKDLRETWIFGLTSEGREDLVVGKD